MKRFVILLLLSFTHLLIPKTIHIFGDSHSFHSFAPFNGSHCIHLSNGMYQALFTLDYMFNQQNYHTNWNIHWLGPKTMYAVGRDSTSFLDLTKFQVQENDCAVFVFGEIDVRCHILKQSSLQRLSIDTIIYRLAHTYITAILENKKKYTKVHCVVVSVLPPTATPPDPHLPTYGSVAQRIVATQKLNYVLQELCEHHNISFLNLYHEFANPEGDFNANYSDGNIHIGLPYSERARQRLLELLVNSGF